MGEPNNQTREGIEHEIRMHAQHLNNALQKHYELSGGNAVSVDLVFPTASAPSRIVIDLPASKT